MPTDTSVPVSETPEEAGVQPPKSSPPPRGHRFLWAFLIVLIAGIVAAAGFENARRNNREPVPDVIKDAPAFALTDADGKPFSSAALTGKPYIIDFIFTRCGGQCPVMTVQMRDLQRWLKEKEFNEYELVSVSVDPEYDTPEVMADYAERFKIDRTNWNFLSGPKEETYPMIKTGFLLGVEENEGENVPIDEEFIHSEKLVLVDSKGRIRGYFAATDDEDMSKLRRVIWSMQADEKAQAAGQ